MTGARERLARVFGIDPRALAALRIGLAAIVLADLALRLSDFETFYTDAGLLPVGILPDRAREVLVPLHAFCGAPAWQAALFAAAGIAAALMLIGLFTRAAVVASFALMLSLHGRSAMVGDFGDEILRQLLFWCMFLPLGCRWSVDAWRRAAPARRHPVLSLASAALLLQIASIYFFTALLKDGPDWRRDGTAIEIVLQRDWALRPFGAFLLEHARGGLRAGTFAVLAFEFFGPLLLFSPFATRLLRTLLVYLAWLFQGGLGLALLLGLMPFVNSVMMLAFLPASWWDAAAGLVRRTPRAAPGAPARARSRPPLALEVLVGLLLLLMLAVNVAGLREEWSLPEPLARAARLVGLQQRWAMFSPDAPRDDGWYTIPGELAGGHYVDLWSAGPELTWRKPARLADVHRSHRWYVYENRLREPAFGEEPSLRFRRRYGEWLCERWNAEHSGAEALLRLGVFWVMEPTLGGGEPPPQVPHRLFEHECAGERAP